MTTGYGWNWSWVTDKTLTKKASGTVYQGGGTIFSLRTPSKGAISSSDLSAFSKSVMQNQQQMRSDWRTYIHPILNSLPSGGIDTRWSTVQGKGLPDKIDCFSYGIQGSTLFVFNDANSTKADGRYWKTDEFRPKTIAECFEDVYEAVYNIETGISTDTDVDLDPLWASVGEEYRDATFRGATGSLSSRISLLDTYIQQLNTDIYEPNNFPYQLGAPPPYSIASVLNEILKIHQVSGGWGSDPSNVGHDAMPIPDHIHPYTDIAPPPAAISTQDRTIGTWSTLENEVLRLRYEIQYTRGSTSWQTDASDPVKVIAGDSDTHGDLLTHMSYVGTGTVSSANPHGIGIGQIDDGSNPLTDMLAAIVSYTGMTNYLDASPTYTSSNFISTGDSLETSISKLDIAVGNIISSGVVAARLEYVFDRSAYSETTRAQTPIVVNHNLGRKPIVDAIDISPTQQDYYGQYSSPAVDLNVVHLNENQLQIWSEAAILEVILIG